MTLEQLQTTQDGLQDVDETLAGLPAAGNIALEIASLRAAVDAVRQLVAAAIRDAA